MMFLASLAALATAGSAYAAFPGANGKIVFERTPGGFGSYVNLGAMNPDGSAYTNLTSDPPGDYEPSWSPDGQKIAFASTRDGDAEIYVMSGDGTGVTQLTHDTGVDGAPAWSPDGQKIAFANGVDIAVMNADGSGFTQLTTPGGPCGAEDYNPDWSPSGDKIAFYREVCLGEDEFDAGLWLVNADGSGQVKLRDGAANPSWSPDGEKIAYKSVGGGGPGSGINIVNADGSGATSLTSGNAPAWSPDGQKIAFVDQPSDIYVINADGTGRAALTTTSEYEGSPGWQPLPGSSPAPPYETPKLASPIQMALVPVFRQCGSGGNPVTGSHSPPLAVGSCNPQLQGVAHFGAQATGTAWIATKYGDTNAANGDQADMTLRFDLSDIRTAAGGDYDPSPSGADGTLVTRLRFTDRANGGSGTDPGTATDFDFSVPFACTPTASTTVGSDCRLDTSADAVNPGMIKENKATVLQVFRLRLNDSGPNGIRGDGDDRLFATEGVFVP